MQIIGTFLTRKNNMGNYFQLSSKELHLEPIKLGKYFMSNSLKTLLLSHWNQQDFVPYIHYGIPCPQINNSKLCRLRQISNGKFKAVKELYLG
jgi:hypothetical protein